ncbi:DUF2905 domain-containing protein [Peribacillus cavernae]|uniref:DUF2905 domain-containing protein n=1 Tax=Peribacillus cavernae TaxID=1674310 RepID=A0A3S0TZJ5_9BACI|nr:DUF2905 domain-containing protein [Peribacillus cavernae]MDQ0219343.1 putative membrane protein YwzB [Peribacillus cavernae]RUQ27779.1 DUF2905 domain-containing protein [Peribacillus cavernae]
MTGLPKLLMTIGVIIFIIGFAMKFINLGKLPGDIFIKKGNTTFYFPVVTSIVISIVLSAVLYLISRFR